MGLNAGAHAGVLLQNLSPQFKIEKSSRYRNRLIIRSLNGGLMQLIDVVYYSVALAAIIMILLVALSYIGSTLRKRRRGFEDLHFRRTILSNRIYLAAETQVSPARVVVENASVMRRIERESIAAEQFYQGSQRSRYKIINEPGQNRFNSGYTSPADRFKKVG